MPVLYKIWWPKMIHSLYILQYLVKTVECQQQFIITRGKLDQLKQGNITIF